MPTLYTHYYFGQDVLKKLTKQNQTEIKKHIKYYNMFNQGFDNLYYHFRWNYYKEFGIKAHKTKIDIFFKNIFNFIETNNLKDQSDITNIIYGFINHYVADTLIHPYINYQVNNLNIPHTKIEFMLDINFQKNTNSNFYKTIIPTLKFNKNLTNLLNYVFKKTHNQENIGKVFNRSHNNGYYIYRYFIHDNFGIKTFLYKIVDYILPFKKFQFHKNTFYIKEYNEDVLNNNKLTWYHPRNIRETYNYSFEELYNLALKISIKLNKDAYKVLHNKKDLKELLSKIKLIDIKNIPELLK